MELLPLILAAPLMVWMAYGDLRFMRIPNWLVLALIAIFLVCAPFLPAASVSARLLTAACVLAVCFAAFALGLFGGGDAKVLSAMMLLVPPGTLTQFSLIFSFAMVLGLGFVLTLGLSAGVARSEWVGLRTRGMFPMGLSISLAGLLHTAVLASQL